MIQAIDSYCLLANFVLLQSSRLHPMALRHLYCWDVGMCSAMQLVWVFLALGSLTVMGRHCNDMFAAEQQGLRMEGDDVHCELLRLTNKYRPDCGLVDSDLRPLLITGTGRSGTKFISTGTCSTRWD